MTAAAMLLLKPSTSPAAAMSLISPPSIPPKSRAAIRKIAAAKVPASFTGSKVSSPVRVIPRHILSGMIFFRMSKTEAAKSRAANKPPCTSGASRTNASRLVPIVEHIDNALLQGRHHSFAEQGVETAEDEGADDNRYQNFK